MTSRNVVLVWVPWPRAEMPMQDKSKMTIVEGEGAGPRAAGIVHEKLPMGDRVCPISLKADPEDADSIREGRRR